MRGSEAMALDRGDLDTAAGLRTVRATKFRKSRQLPLQVTTPPGSCQLPGRARPDVPGAGDGQPAGVCDRGAAVPGHCAVGLPPPAPPGRDRPGPAAAPADHPRPASQLRGQDPAAHITSYLGWILLAWARLHLLGDGMWRALTIRRVSPGTGLLR